MKIGFSFAICILFMSCDLPGVVSPAMQPALDWHAKHKDSQLLSVVYGTSVSRMANMHFSHFNIDSTHFFALVKDPFLSDTARYRLSVRPAHGLTYINDSLTACNHLAKLRAKELFFARETLDVNRLTSRGSPIAGVSFVVFSFSDSTHLIYTSENENLSQEFSNWLSKRPGLAKLDNRWHYFSGKYQADALK